MSQFSVNATRPIVFYFLVVAALCGFSYALTRDLIEFDYVFQFEHKKFAAMAMFALSGVIGVFAILKNSDRNEKPWKTTRAQVNTLFALFLAVTLVAILLTK